MVKEKEKLYLFLFKSISPRTFSQTKGEIVKNLECPDKNPRLQSFIKNCKLVLGFINLPLRQHSYCVSILIACQQFDIASAS